MKRFGWVLSGVAVLMLAVAAPAAKKEEGAKKGKPDKAAKGEKPEKGKGGDAASLGVMAKILELTEDQQAAIKDAMAESKKAMGAWMKGEDGQKLKELMTQLKEAKKANQTEDVKALMGQIKELSKARQQIMAGAKTAVLDILTDEQKAKWDEYIASKKKGGPKKDGDAPKKGGKKGKGGKKPKGGEPAPE